MNVLIINTNRCAEPVPIMPVGACMVAEATVMAGHTVKLLDLMYTKDHLHKLETVLKSETPNVIGLSVRNIDDNNMENPVAFWKDLIPLITTIRENNNVPIVLGGPALSIMPEQLLRLTNATAAVLGEGEKVFPELLSAFSKNKNIDQIPGTAHIQERNFKINYNSSHQLSDGYRPPDLTKWIDINPYLSRLGTVPIQTKRGCPYSCIYCTYPQIEGTDYRLCPPEQITESLRELERKGIKDIEFVDNVFNAPYEHAYAICENIIRAQIHPRLQTLEISPQFVDDTLLSVMEKAGFIGIGITAESASDIVLSKLSKGFTSDDVHKSAQVINRHKIPCLWIFMVGGPGETRETVLETLNFADRYIRPTDSAFFSSGIRIYPGTELERIARREGLLQCSRQEMLAPVFYFSPALDTQWVKETLRKVMQKRMNYFTSNSINLPFLSTLHRIGYRLGITPPLWTKARYIRRLLKLLRIDP